MHCSINSHGLAKIANFSAVINICKIKLPSFGKNILWKTGKSDPLHSLSTIYNRSIPVSISSM